MPNIIPELYSLPTQAILDAISEYEQLGEDAFLKKYAPYNPATVYFGIHGDTRFPPRAVLAAAYAGEVAHQRNVYPKNALYIVYGIQIEKVGGELVGVGGQDREIRPWEINDEDLEATAFRYAVPSG